MGYQQQECSSDLGRLLLDNEPEEEDADRRQHVALAQRGQDMEEESWLPRRVQKFSIF